MAAVEYIRSAVAFALSNWAKLLFAYLAGRAIYRRYLHPLKDVPGPWLASLTRLWLFFVQFDDQQHMLYVDLHRKYGPVVRVSPNQIIITAADSLPDYFGFDKAVYWKAFGLDPHSPNHGNILNVKEHRVEKAKVMGAYTLSQIMKSEKKVDSHLLELMEQLTARCGKKIDLAPWLQYFGWDVAMDVALSKPMGFVKHGYDVRGQVQSLHRLLKISAAMAIYPSIPQFINHPLWYPALSPKTTAETGIGAIQGLAINTVEARFQNPQPDSPDIIQWMMDHKDKDGNKLGKARIQMEAMAPVLAGSDTTASTLRSMLLRIITTPRVYNKLMAQIDTADDAGLLSVPPTHEQITRHVPYIDSIRKEALRMLPAAGAPFFREVPPQGTTIAGHFIPGGTDVGVQHWAISRDPVFWGDDYDLFRPERWTDEKDEHRRKMRDLGDVFFSNGTFMCTGRNLAIMELLKMPIELLRRFDAQVVNAAEPWKEKSSLAMLHTDFWVKLTPRERGRKGE